MKARLVDILLVLTVGAFAYSNTLDVPYTLDDVGEILTSPFVQDLALAVEQLPTASRAFGRFTFALNHAVHGFDVTGYHLVNIAIHLLAAIAVYALARTVLRAAGADEPRRRLAGLAAALLFVAHPVQTQAVTYVVQRYASLATLLCVTSLLLYARSRLETGRGRIAIQYLGALILAFLAMRTKEIALTLPLAIALFEVLFVRASTGERLRWLAPPLLLLAVIPLLHLRVQGSIDAGAATFDTVSRAGTTVGRGEYLLTQARVVVDYLRLLVFPVGQNVDHDVALSRSLDLPVVASMAVLVAVLAFGIWLIAMGRRRASPEALVAGFGVVLFFLFLSVESSLIPIRDLMVEHRLYLPNVGACLAAGVGIAAGHGLVAARVLRARALVPAALAGVVLVLGVASHQRNAVWADPVALWSDAAAKSPGKLRPILNWAGALRKRGDRQAALQVAMRGLALPASDHEELLAVGFVYRELGDLRKARELWEESLSARPDFAHTLVALGNLDWDEGDRASALQYFERAVEANPALGIAHLKLAIALDAAGETERSLQEFELFTRYALPSHAAEAAQIRQMLLERRAAVGAR